jgi:hypothetical protein
VPAAPEAGAPWATLPTGPRVPGPGAAISYDRWSKEEFRVGR